MTFQSAVLIALIGILYLLWIVNLVRKKRLHVSYATVWAIWTILGIVIVVANPLLELITQVLGAAAPINAINFLAFMLLFAMQIYLLSQITTLAKRITMIAQHIA